MNRKSKPFMSAGLSSILLVFVLLCLITFSVLSLVSANADYRFSERAAKRTSAWYEAQNRANLRLKEIDGALAEQYNKTENEALFAENAAVELEKLEGVAVTREDGRVRASFAETIGEEEQLFVELEITYPQQDGDSRYKVRAWQSVQTGEWSADDALPVLQQ